MVSEQLRYFFYFSTETLRGRILSPPLSRGLASLKKHIDAVTEEQYTILDFLRLHRRASIVGCAGSGKTLIAMEKATRLVKSGMKTLILCNNPFLAEYMTHALQYTGVEVDTFCRFVRNLTGTHPETQRWSYFDEPTDAELTLAFDKLFDSDERYDAILVDEAQDFADGWWLLVEAALKSQEHSFLYLFSDNNQALLPFRTKYPVAAAPVSLTVNCRNAVEIAKVVARFNPNPTRMLDRLGGGTLTISQFNRVTLDEILARMLGAIWATGVDQSCCVITTEPGSPSDSVLARKSVVLPGWKWQKAVKDTIARHGAILQYRARGYAGPLPQLEVPILSDGAFPTVNDIAAVEEFARRVLSNSNVPLSTAATRLLRWVFKQDGLQLAGPGLQLSRHVLTYFCSEQWHTTLPVAPEFRLIPHDELTEDSGIRIGLHTASSAKGLEADAIITYISKFEPDLQASTYVALSRARLQQHILIAEEVVRYLPQLYERAYL